MTVASVALSLTGSGHLLVYQLGACRVLSKSSSLQIHQVVGSSGGAIVASLMALNLDLDAFAQSFLRTGGQALSLLQEQLQQDIIMNGPALSICTTQCRDGREQMFDFSVGSTSADPRLMPALMASCRIPGSFHPYDMLSSTNSFADSEGVGIDDNFYVDGGIAAPAPRTLSTLRRIVISPIAGKSSSSSDCWRVSPSGARFCISMKLRHNFRVDASIANLRALRAAAGMTTGSELKSWYQRGQDDAQLFEEETLKSHSTED
jgi:predicted acylesterase/phospholipase RssA